VQLKTGLIAKELKQFRRQHNLTQKKAAEYFEIRLGTIRDYEQGRTKPNPITVIGIMAKIQANPVDEERLRKIAQTWVAPAPVPPIPVPKFHKRILSPERARAMAKARWNIEFTADIPTKGMK
jgi:transcriptional regulator with XRE-family HTH domain